jgi:ubiquitin-protein ligase E3 C
LQQNPVPIAQCLDLQALSQSIINTFSTQESFDKVQGDGLFWLLAYFVALNRTISASQGSTYLEALYLQLSALATEVRLRHNQEIDVDDADESSDEDEDVASKKSRPLPPYVADQLDFLVNEDGISELLKRFTS